MADSNPARPIYGPTLVGIYFNILLYGITILQSYLYYANFTRDKRWIKVFIVVLVLADTVNTAFDMAFIYDALIDHWANSEYIQTASWIFRTDPAMTAVIAMMVQLFFAWRVKVLTSNWYATIAIAAFSFVQFAGGLSTSILIGKFPKFLDFQNFKPAVIIWLAGSAVCDCLITFILVLYLRRYKTGFNSTDDIVDRIIRLTVQTGLITSVVAVIDLCLYLTNPTGLHLAFNMPLSKLYTNSLLSSLNARNGWAFNSSSDPSPSTNDRRSKRHPDVITLGTSSVRPEVYVNVESHEMTDSPRLDRDMKHADSDHTFEGSISVDVKTGQTNAV
ncbi:hypothetical protein EW146_g2704 [Bondarzewia mesenterica]|uniref:DUF6534 domain-containing protein n=1 Tax=Bondarzewia mesenterica TaxID=1095465 RepID=A0A4S4M0B6_9AGAM|nr:hypothetical protein EW146_g2704 [Bondarzewia mesenterica]